MQYRWKRNTVIFLVSQAISLFGSSLVQYAITWHITLTTLSGVNATLSIVFGMLPMFFLAPFAGVWADRYNRKILIVAADAGIALCTLVIAIVFLTGKGNLWILYAALFVRAVGSAVQTPCIGAMLPDMVPEEQLTRVNGINGSVQSLITLASPMLSGVLLGFAPLGAIFFVDVGTAAIAITVMLTSFHLPASRVKKSLEESATAASKNYFHELREGLRYVRRNSYLTSYFVLCILFFFMFAPVAFLTPLQVSRNYADTGNSVQHLVAIEMAFSIGMTVGGLAIAAWGGFKNRIYTMSLMGFIMAACTFALGLPMPLVLYVAIMALFGLVMPMFSTPAMVLLQERTDPAYIGRIFGIMTMVNTGAMPLGMLVFGPLADTLPIEWLFLSTGVVLMLISFIMVRNKALVAAGRKQPRIPEEKPPGAESASG